MAGEEAAGERRREPRIEKIQLVQVSRFDEEGMRADFATGRSLNISRSGVRLELHHPLPLRSVVSLSLALGDDILDITGRVVYLEEVDDQKSAMGIAFVGLTPEEQAKVDRYIAASSS